MRARLDKGEIQIEPGALYYMRGQLQLEASTQGVKKGLMRSFLSGETLFQSRIRGTGEVYLDPSFGHFIMFNIDNDALIVDKGAFYCRAAAYRSAPCCSATSPAPCSAARAFFRQLFGERRGGAGLAGAAGRDGDV
ncbi:MAG: AIM24 family protein [Candidatus Competibacteraceae bacterium]